MGRRGLWTGLRLVQISQRLEQLDLSVCPNTVRRLLEGLGYALHANRKSLSGPQSPERPARDGETLLMKHHGTGQVFATADALSEFLLIPVLTGRPR